jgi:hypothetical protein
MHLCDPLGPKVPTVRPATRDRGRRRVGTEDMFSGGCNTTAERWHKQRIALRSPHHRPERLSRLLSVQRPKRLAVTEGVELIETRQDLGNLTPGEDTGAKAVREINACHWGMRQGAPHRCPWRPVHRLEQ